jgi:hypothetical protein
LLKATGHGLAVPFSEITVSAPDMPAALLAWTAEPTLDQPVYLRDLSAGPEHAGCLAVLGIPLHVVEKEGSGLLIQTPDAAIFTTPKTGNPYTSQ